MTKAKSWEVTEEFWKRVEPLMPIRQRLSDQTYTRKSGGGRKPKAPRLVFEAIVFVLRTGCQWKAPLAQSTVGPNPTDRGKKWEQAPFAGGRSWRPVVARRDRSQSA